MEKLERRFRLFQVSPDLMLKMIAGAEVQIDIGQLVVFWSDLEPDAQVLAVNFEPHTDNFLFKLYHPAWDIVPKHSLLTIYSVTIRRHCVKLTEKQISEIEG